MIIGEKYYRVKDGILDVIRIYHIDNNGTITIMRGVAKSRVKEDYIETHGFIKLNPDGYMFFNIVSLGEGDKVSKDVMVCLNRKEDIDNNNSVPFCTCRQGVYDYYSNLTNRNHKITYLGMSMSVLNVPEGESYTMMLSCNSLEHSEKIAVYMDDSLNKILMLLPNKLMYDVVLYDMYKAIDKKVFRGSCRSIVELLAQNKFMYDFRSAFDIHEVDFKVKVLGEYTLDPKQTLALEDRFKVEMFSTYVTKFSKEINLKKIERSYVLIADKIDTIYVVAYDKGEYLNRPYRDRIKDKRDAAMLLQHTLNKNK